MKGSAAVRLHRLRWVLTWLFTALNAAGLIVFAWLAVQADFQQREVRLDGDLHAVAAAAKRLVKDDGAVVTALIGRDELNDQCPQFAIMPAGSGHFAEYLSNRKCVPMDPAQLRGFAEVAVSRGAVINAYSHGTGGELVRVAAEPFRNPDFQYAGAIVVVADARAEQAAHNQVLVFTGVGGVLLVAVLAVAGHFLSGRAIRPASAALEQQEVLLAETAHDLRTPVAALRALAETALRNPDERAGLLPRTVRLAGRMGTIIDGLLVRARLAAGVEQLAIQPVWLDQLVRAVVAETPAEDAHVGLSTSPSRVLADPGLLQRAVGNLFENALRHGRTPGSQAVVHITVAGGRVVVADHGPGIDPAVAEENFDRFSSGAGSSGLGLSIVRWAAVAHGGTLRVYPNEGGGAIFELALPEDGQAR